MQQIDATQVSQYLNVAALIDALQTGFGSDIQVPQRQHFDIPNPLASRETTLLLMPAWNMNGDIGVKLVTVAPENHRLRLPSIQGTYVLMDATNGAIKALIDAPSLTAKRTAAASALASRILSRVDSHSLLMVGTGTLAPHLIEAHAAVRPIKNVYIWGRSKEKAEAVRRQVEHLDVQCIATADIAAHASEVDIISVATLSKEPLISGEWLQAGQHLDLVGAYRPDMREADDQCLLRSRIFVDNRATASKETGDLLIPLREGTICQQDIESDLFTLCKPSCSFTRDNNDITLFKSVGHALEDLVAAQLLAATLEDTK